MSYSRQMPYSVENIKVIDKTMYVSNKKSKLFNFLNVRILRKTLDIREKIQENDGGIPTKSQISQLQNATECRKWYQMIAMSLYFIHVIRYKSSDFLLSNINQNFLLSNIN